MPIEKAMKNPAITGALSGLVGGTLASALTNKKTARNLLKTGGLLAVGGVAWKAYDSYRKSNSGAVESQSHPEEAFVETAEEYSTLIIDAMIAAAHADGRLTEAEKEGIWQEVLATNLPGHVLDQVSMRIEHPLSTAELALQANTTELKIEVYTATILMLDSDCIASNDYLDDLAALLGLPNALRQALDRSVADKAVAA